MQSSSNWQQRLNELATTELRRLASSVGKTDIEPWLREAIRDAATDLRRELRRGSTDTVEGALDRVGVVLERILEELDRQIEREARCAPQR